MGKKTCLVTGGAGFIGSHVVDDLILSGHNVIVLDDLSGGKKENVHPSATFIEGSILDVDLLDKIFTENKIDYVYHLAAYAAEGLSHFIRRFNYQNNLIGSINLINESVKHEIEHFVFTSSVAAHGHADVPEDPYGIAKHAVELDLWSARVMFGLRYTIFRPHNVYGIRQNINDPYRNVIGIFLKKSAEGKPLPIFGLGSQRRAFTHVSDVAPYIARAPEYPEHAIQAFDIGSDEFFSIKEVALMISNHIEVLPARKEVLVTPVDHSDFKRVFWPKTPVALKDGLKEMKQWVSEQRLFNTRPFKDIEITKNLPPSWAKL